MSVVKTVPGWRRFAWNRELGLFLYDDLEGSTITLDLARHTEALAKVLCLRGAELWSVSAPNDYGEDLLRIRPVEIQEGGLTPA